MFPGDAKTVKLFFLLLIVAKIVEKHIMYDMDRMSCLRRKRGWSTLENKIRKKMSEIRKK